MEKTYEQLYPGEAFEKNRWHKTCSILQKLLETYLIQQSFDKEHSLQKIWLSKAFRERQLADAGRKAIKIAQKEQLKQPHRGADYFELSYKISLEEFYFASKEKRLGDHHLQQLSDTLDVTYVIRKLRYACLTIAHSTLNPQDYEIGLLPSLLSDLETSKLLDETAVSLYYNCYRMLSTSDGTTYFNLLTDLLLQHDDILPTEEMRDLFLMTINYCIRQLNTSKKGFAEPGLKLFKHGLLKGLLLRSGKLSRYTYYNCFIMALSANEYDWAEQFLDEYQKVLERTHRQEMYDFCRMRLYYEQKRYDEALKLLNFINYPDLLFQLSARVIQLKIYYETDELDLLQSQIDALRTFLQRKKMMGYHRGNFQNIIRYMQKLVNRNPFDQKETEKIRKEVEEEEVLTERGWFVKQLNS